MGRLSRRPLGHGGCSVPMNRWTNAGGSIDGHLPSAWRVLYKRVYRRLKAGDVIDTSIPLHGEGCMPQAAALRMSLWVPARNVWAWLSKVCWVVGGHCAGGEAESGRSMWPLNASPRARAYRGLDLLVERPVVCPPSGMPHSAAEIYALKGWSSAARGMENSKISSKVRYKEKPTSVLERLDRWSREGPMGSRLQNSH